MILPKTITAIEFIELYRLLNDHINYLLIQDRVLFKFRNFRKRKPLQFPNTTVILSSQWDNHTSRVNRNSIPLEDAFAVYSKSSLINGKILLKYKEAFIRSFFEMRAKGQLIT